MKTCVIYCADIGSVASNSFAWARKIAPWDSSSEPASDMAGLITRVSDDLKSGTPVALGFECPLFIPIRENPRELLRARRGEKQAWSGGPGANVLVTGLAQTEWILRKLKESVGRPVRVFFDWAEFCRNKTGLFLWEAFVAGRAKGGSHASDAQIAVEYFASNLRDLPRVNALEEDNVFSLVGAALLRAGWTKDVSFLAKPCLVLKP